MSLLTALIVFTTKFVPQWKDRESNYQVRETLVHSCKLVALFLRWNCVEDLRITQKNRKAWGKWEAIYIFQETVCKFFVVVYVFNNIIAPFECFYC